MTVVQHVAYYHPIHGFERAQGRLHELHSIRRGTASFAFFSAALLAFIRTILDRSSRMVHILLADGPRREAA